MKPRVLQAGRFTPAIEAEFARDFDVHPLWNEPDSRAYVAKNGKQFVGLITTGMVGADAALIDALPALKVIASRGVGFDKIDLDAARARGIVVSNTPGVLTDCVADLAFGLLLGVARQIPAADRFVRRGDWTRGRFQLTTRVSGKRLGVVGLGRIGSAVVKRAAGFDMEVRYFGQRPQDAPFRFEPSLIELARWCDFLVVTVAGGASTRRLINADVLAALGPKGFLINVARGSVVDEKALVDALVNQRIAGAGLDVFENEPAVPAELLTLDNVVLLPHLASSTNETWTAMEELVLANLRSYFKDARVLTPVV